MKSVLKFLRRPVPLVLMTVVYMVGLGPTLISATSTPLVLLGIGLGVGLGHLIFTSVKEQFQQ